jgi:NAD(P)-dependent dehydrogenase (short-subunit alcohol dehydrogenase family)
LGVSSGRLTKREAWNQTWDVNVTGTHLFTETFAPLLLASNYQSPRLVFMTSGLASVTELATGTSHRYTLPPAGWPKPKTLWFPYRSSKTGLNMVAAEWARLLHNDGVKVFNISPGFLNTSLGNDRASSETIEKGAMGAMDPAIGGEYCADVVEGKLDEQAWPLKTLRKGMVQPW